jgi:hypothetical protein
MADGMSITAQDRENTVMFDGHVELAWNHH